MRHNFTMSDDSPHLSPPHAKLADFLCFTLYSANLVFGRAYKPLLDELGLTYPQYIVILALWEEDNQTVCRLGEKLFLESNTLTPVLKRLDAMGHVWRQRSTRDERQVHVGLTAAGRALREKAAGMSLREACGLTPDEFAGTRDILATLRGNLIRAMGK